MEDQKAEGQEQEQAENNGTQTVDASELMAELEKLKKSNSTLQSNYDKEKAERLKLLQKVETDEDRIARERQEAADALRAKESELTEYGRRLARVSVMVKNQIPAELERFLTGDNEEEVEKSWKDLSATLEKLSRDIRTKEATTEAPRGADGKAAVMPFEEFNKLTAKQQAEFVNGGGRLE